MAEIDAVACRVVEMRFFAGMSLEEVAAALVVSRSTVVRTWRFARAWLEHRLQPEGSSLAATEAAGGAPPAGVS